MKLRLLFTLPIFAMLNVDSFALEIYKGKLLEHKEWATGNAKGFFKANRDEKNTFKEKLQLRQENRTYLSTYAKAASAKGNIGTLIDLQGNQYVLISNDTTTAQRYFYTFSICSVVDTHTTNCLFYSDRIELEPGGFATTSEVPTLRLSFEDSGEYAYFVNTYLGNDYESSNQINSSSSSEGMITIS